MLLFLDVLGVAFEIIAGEHQSSPRGHGRGNNSTSSPRKRITCLSRSKRIFFFKGLIRENALRGRIETRSDSWAEAEKRLICERRAADSALGL